MNDKDDDNVFTISWLLILLPVLTWLACKPRDFWSASYIEYILCLWGTN